MTQEHPITPPTELVQQWVAEIWHEGTSVQVAASGLHIATQAARWGSDQELEACVNYVDNTISGNKARALRAIRRPKPPSLKEQALLTLASADGADHPIVATVITADQHALIRRALESLPD